MDDANEQCTTSRRIIQVEKRLCPHCNKILSFKTFKAHKRLHFDALSGKWQVSSATSHLSFESRNADEDAPSSLGIRQETLSEDIDFMPPSSIFDG